MNESIRSKEKSNNNERKKQRQSSLLISLHIVHVNVWGLMAYTIRLNDEAVRGSLER